MSIGIVGVDFESTGTITGLQLQPATAVCRVGGSQVRTEEYCLHLAQGFGLVQLRLLGQQAVERHKELPGRDWVTKAPVLTSEFTIRATSV